MMGRNLLIKLIFKVGIVFYLTYSYPSFKSFHIALPQHCVSVSQTHNPCNSNCSKQAPVLTSGYNKETGLGLR